MAKVAGFTPVGQNLFGFYNVFGFFIVRFLQCVRLDFVRFCSVDFVENLCKSLRKSLWVKSGKVLAFWWKTKFCTFLWINIRKMWENVESFTIGFTQRFSPVKFEFYTFSTEPTITTINILEERI